MRIHFEPDLDFQLDAIEAVCDLFRGQETCRTEFTVTSSNTIDQQLGAFESDLGVGNRLTLRHEDVLTNLADVQLRNGLAPSTSLTSGDFTVEMETGTGKTYVYLRTLFELNKRFGFTKFVIVVPSIAIKEGVYKSLQMMESHLRGLYDNAPFDYFLYDSTRLNQVRNFATSPHIQVMVATVGAINKKDINNLYKDSEKTDGEKPIDLIRATRPIIIVDEPQSVDGGLTGAGRTALEAMEPLCTLRYSATHVDKHHMVYKLDAVDAYERKLVKQIEVASAAISGGHNRPYARVVSVSNRRGVITARLELDVEAAAGGVLRRELDVHDGDDLQGVTRRAIYAECAVGEVRVAPGDPYVELRTPTGEVYLRVGEAWGDVEPLAVQRQMIRRTIKEHLDKEWRLHPMGIKVLSLFFVDAVDKYRRYDSEGGRMNGVYADLFEEEYVRWAAHPDYRDLFGAVDVAGAVAQVHDGYFSIDKSQRWTDTDEKNQVNRENAQRAYSLIMRDKEKLLGFETPLKFIFSHSALREGWDNPNVFQICALREIRTERDRRQTIGRGLRLCVNQDGERVRGFDVNTLTVVAREAYEDFAAGLQQEIEEDTGIRFGVVEPDQFAAIALQRADGEIVPMGTDRSRVLWESLKAAGYLDARGRVLDSLRTALRDGAVSLPVGFEAYASGVEGLLRKLSGRLDVKNADERRLVRPRESVLKSPEFKALWDRVKYKTRYRVEFDNEALIAECAEALRDAPPVPPTRLQWTTAEIRIGKSGVTAEQRAAEIPNALVEGGLQLPDILTELQDRTQLTRRSILRILRDSGRLDDFRRNPQGFIDGASEAIRRRKRMALVDGIKYQRIGDESYYAQELFSMTELTGYIRNMLDTDKSVYEQVVYDTPSEGEFADQLEKNKAIKVYAKLPGWFTVPTPLGTYNPDWAILVLTQDGERLYFVVETKAGPWAEDLRGTEDAKIRCGTRHFEALKVREDPAEYLVAKSVDDVLIRSMQ